MFKASHATLVALSGIVWLIVGCVLLSLGINFIIESILHENIARISRPILDHLVPITGGLEQAALLLMGLCLLVGYMKGRFIFGKAVQKGVQRILSLPAPVSLSQIYTLRYYILLASMVLMGVLVRLTPMDVRGAIDVIIGFALINGACLYFYQAFKITCGKASL